MIPIEQTSEYPFVLPPHERESLRRTLIRGEGRMRVYQGLLHGGDLTSAAEYYWEQRNILVEEPNISAAEVEERVAQLFDREVLVGRRHQRAGTLREHMATTHIENATIRARMNRKK